MSKSTRETSKATRRRITVIADDLTGATDTVMQFRQASWTAYLLLSDEFSEDWSDPSEQVAISRALNTRAMSVDLAAERTSCAVSAELAAGTDRLYLKIDSTMRGSVAAQVTGALRAWNAVHPEALAVICPAYPQMGRVIIDGSMSVDGVALDQSPIGFDPITPVATSLLTELIPGAIAIPNLGSASELADMLLTTAESTDRVVVDAREDKDLRRLAAAIELLGTHVVSIGSAGLARHLAEVWRPAEAAAIPTGTVSPAEGTVIVAVSSLNKISLAQIDHLVTALDGRLERHEFSVEQLQDGPGMRALGRARFGATTRDHDVVLIQPNPARTQGVDTTDAARSIARGLAAAVGGIVDSGDVSALALVGGDGAQATLRELDASALRVECQASEGVPIGRIVGGPAAGMPVLTKAGGFGSITTLTEVVTEYLRP